MDPVNAECVACGYFCENIVEDVPVEDDSVAVAWACPICGQENVTWLEEDLFS
jgi:predicted RNA-binding Zn-ribbon protein involved in translation (DUF1610 family)